MRKAMMGLVDSGQKNLSAKLVLHTHEEELQEEDEAMFVGGEPRATEPVVLSHADSKRLWDLVLNKEPVTLTARMKEAIANYNQIMNEVVD